MRNTKKNMLKLLIMLFILRLTESKKLNLKKILRIISNNYPFSYICKVL